MEYTIEPIRPEHDESLCKVIKSVGAEFGAIGEGFGPSDEEVLRMSRHYHADNKSLYLVATLKNRIVGGGGIAAFNNSERICELRKLFLLQEGRGLGIGEALSRRCLDFARAKGFKQCYLDTASNMTAAIKLYEKIGFGYLQEPLAGTPHNSCDVWMLKEL